MEQEDGEEERWGGEGGCSRRTGGTLTTDKQQKENQKKHPALRLSLFSSYVSLPISSVLSSLCVHIVVCVALLLFTFL